MDFLQTLTAQYESYETYLIIFESVAVFFGLLSVFLSNRISGFIPPVSFLQSFSYILPINLAFWEI